MYVCVCMHVCLKVCMSFCRSLSVSVCLSVGLSVCLSVFVRLWVVHVFVHFKHSPICIQVHIMHTTIHLQGASMCTNMCLSADTHTQGATPLNSKPFSKSYKAFISLLKPF